MRSSTTCEELNIRAHLGRADVFTLIGEYSRAKQDYEIALSETTIPHTKITALLGLSYVESMTGNFDTALSLSGKAGTIAKKHRFITEEIKTLNSKSILLYRKGAYTASDKLSEHCLKILKTIHEKDKKEAVQRGMAKAFNNIGNVCFDTKQYKKAIEAYKKALTIEKSMNNEKGIGALYNNIGIVYRKINRPNDSIRYYEKAAAVFKKIGDRFGEMTILANLGVAYSDFKKIDFEKVFELFERALLFAENIGNETVVIWMLNNIAAIYTAQYQYNKAMITYKKALRMAEKKNDRTMVDMICGNMANIHLHRGDYENALSYYKKCRKLEETIFSERSTVATLLQIIKIEFEQGKIPAVVSHYNQLKKLVSKYKLYDYEASLDMVRGDMHTFNEAFDRADLCYRKALKHYTKANAAEEAAFCLCKIAANGLAGKKPNPALVEKTISKAERCAVKAESDEAAFCVYSAFVDLYLCQHNTKKTARYLRKLKSLSEKPALGKFYPCYLIRVSKARLTQGKSAQKQLKEATKRAHFMGLKPLLKEIEKLSISKFTPH